METNLIVSRTSKLIELLNYLFLNNKNRQYYLDFPKAVQQRFNLETIVDFESSNNLFYRFIKDDEIWNAIQKKDEKKLKNIVDKKFPELKSNDIESGAIFIFDVLVATNSIVAANSLVKIAAIVVGISENELY